MNTTFRIFVAIFICASFSQVELKNYAVCELAEELLNNYSIPRENIYKHLCIIGDLMHTNYSSSGFHGIYRIGELWWCGQNETGGNCNVKCDDLKDDDIRDDVACAEKVFESHGTQGWMKSDDTCNRTFSPKVDSCLETIVQFEEKIETTTMINSYKDLKSEEIHSNTAMKLNFVLGFLLIASIGGMIVIFIKYQNIRLYVRNSINTSVQMSAGNEHHHSHV